MAGFERPLTFWAASCVREANEITAKIRRSEGVYYRPEEHEAFVDKVIKNFDVGFFGRTAGLGLDTRRPVFVVGLPRSGTTLVEQILASHRRVYGAGERLFSRKSFEKLSSVLNCNFTPLDCVPALNEYGLKRLAGEQLAELNALDSGRHDRIVDKMPENYLYVGLLKAMFPDAVFVSCRRDLRDVAVSCWMSDFRSVRWANDLDHIGSRIAAYHKLMLHWHGLIGPAITVVDYEDMVLDFEGTVRRLLDACGLEWEPACLQFHKTPRVVQTASVTQVRQPIYRTSMARWKHYEHGLGDVFERLGKLGSRSGSAPD